MKSAAGELSRVIADNIDKIGAVERHAVDRIQTRNWASATFTGGRHSIVLRLEGARAGQAADDFLNGLSEREFALRGHIVADIHLVAEERTDRLVRLTLEALTVEDF